MDQALSKPVVFTILGAPRSGTSALTRAFPALGVSLGPAATNVGVQNPKGFWEDSAAFSINERLMRLEGDELDFEDWW